MTLYNTVLLTITTMLKIISSDLIHCMTIYVNLCYFIHLTIHRSHIPHTSDNHQLTISIILGCCILHINKLEQSLTGPEQ